MRTGGMHLNRVPQRQKPPSSGHQNILSAGKGKYFVRIGSIDYPRRYTKEEIPEAIEFRDRIREKIGYPKADC